MAERGGSGGLGAPTAHGCLLLRKLLIEGRDASSSLLQSSPSSIAIILHQAPGAASSHVTTRGLVHEPQRLAQTTTSFSGHDFRRLTGFLLGFGHVFRHRRPGSSQLCPGLLRVALGRFSQCLTLRTGFGLLLRQLLQSLLVCESPARLEGVHLVGSCALLQSLPSLLHLRSLLLKLLVKGCSTSGRLSQHRRLLLAVHLELSGLHLRGDGGPSAGLGKRLGTRLRSQLSQIRFGGI
mmetsp:Transcript_91147/g.217418  ORF Transcript_91147/g.217418 Transcript_91147/m.217418 type:complete len:237 (+) Transcript_91147:2634-3344(+)